MTVPSHQQVMDIHAGQMMDASRVCTLSTVAAFLLGNLLLMDVGALRVSSILLAASLLFQSSVFYLSVRTASLGAGLLIVVSLLAISVIIDNPYVVWGIVLLSVAMAMANVRAVIAADTDARTSLLIKVSLIGALVIISARSPVSFDMLQRLELGTAHRDTLYHASIASMLKHHGVISTGLSGLVETPYHVLSHLLIVAISELTGIPVFETYGVLPLLMLLPLLIALYAYLVTCVDPRVSYLRAYFLTALVLAITPRILKIWGLKESYFGSESYMLSLILFAPLLLLLVKHRLDLKDRMVIVGLAGLAAAAKATVGVAVVGLFLVRLMFFTRGWRNIMATLALFSVMAAMVIAVVAPAASGNLGGVSVGYWEYVKSSSLMGEMIDQGVFHAVVPVAMFIVFHFILNWLVLRSRLIAGYGMYLWRDPVVVYNLMAVIAAVSVVMLPLVANDAAYYFSGAAVFLALPWLVAMLAKQRFEKIRYPLMTAVVLILVFKGGKLLDKSALKRDEADDVQQDFVQQLVQLREYSGQHMMLRRDPANALYSANPLSPCEFEPFVYPAVTESPWLGVIYEDCVYLLYGYANYLGADYSGFDDMAVVIPEGFTIKDY